MPPRATSHSSHRSPPATTPIGVRAWARTRDQRQGQGAQRLQETPPRRGDRGVAPNGHFQVSDDHGGERPLRETPRRHMVAPQRAIHPRSGWSRALPLPPPWAASRASFPPRVTRDAAPSISRSPLWSRRGAAAASSQYCGGGPNENSATPQPSVAGRVRQPTYDERRSCVSLECDR